jgi:hypothetical protein
MKRGIFGLIALCLVFVFVLAGCPNPNTDLPIETIRFELDRGGYYQFYTNDPQYYNKVLMVGEYREIPDLTSLEFDCKKISGNKNHGYGLIIITGTQTAFKSYYIGINTQKYYCVEKYDSTAPSGTNPWSYVINETPSTKLNAGYDTPNRIKVTSEDKEFSVLFNNDATTDATFTIEEEIIQVGYFVIVGSETGEYGESFPNTPVDVRFRIIAIE